MIAALYTVYIFCCIFLILVVLLQAGRGGGMALGGGSQQQAFGGGGAAPIMKNLTIGTAGLWLVLNLVLAYLGTSRNSAAVYSRRIACRTRSEPDWTGMCRNA